MGTLRHGAVGSHKPDLTAALGWEAGLGESRDGLQTRNILDYTARNTIRVQVTNIRAAGRLLDLAFQAGANTVDDVRFALKDPEAAQNQALRDASAKARARAHALAEGQGMRVGDVISLGEGQKDGPFGGIEGVYFDAYKRSANMVPMPIEPGSIEVTGTVTVIFALKPR